MTAISELATYANVTLPNAATTTTGQACDTSSTPPSQAIGQPCLTGLHVQYWGAWNEPDNENGKKPANDGKFPKDDQNPPLTAARYALWADQALEYHDDMNTGKQTLPAVSTGCAAKKYSCVVIAGEFAFFRRHFNPPANTREFNISRYLQYMRGWVTSKARFSPRIWSYHAYYDISNADGDTHGVAPESMGDTIAMTTEIAHSQFHIDDSPQVWMTEGADALTVGATGGTDANSGAPAVLSSGACGSPAATNTSAIEAGIGRFLALTTGTNAATPTDPGLQGAALNDAGKVSEAIYYEISAGGAGSQPWGNGPHYLCTYPNVPVPLGKNPALYSSGFPNITSGGFDSGLFESDREAQLATSSFSPTTLRPRLAYCLLTKDPNPTTDCTGNNAADVAPLPGN
jgi:hypothetical protein